MLQSLKNTFHLITAVVAVCLNRYPSRHLLVIGVTGTDGKTTTVNLIYHILKAAGKKASLVSTINAVIGKEVLDTGFHVTSPSPFLLQKLMRKAADNKDKYFVLEVTSHGIDQNRIWGCNFEVGVLTNVTHEHLDYHRDYQNYFQTKLRLIRMSPKKIINTDDHSYDLIPPSIKKRAISYGIHNKQAMYTPITYPFQTGLVGDFNKYNILAAIACAKSLGISDQIIKKAVETFKAPFGRMDEVHEEDFRVVIDFAHTPNAIKYALSATRNFTKGKIIHVFGSAGLRDRTKREIMGKESAALADYMVITAEDPRTEDARDISDQIAQGCISKGVREANKRQNPEVYLKGKSKYFWKIADRQEAINFAIRKLVKPADTVIITGKGHEKSMCYGKTEYPWSDYDAVQKALRVS